MAEGCRSRRIPAVFALPLALAACDPPTSMGDNSDIVVAIPQAEWSALRADVMAALEPTIFTVRDERIFEVAHVDPTTAAWGNYRKVRQVLVVGEAADPWVAEALDKVDGDISSGPGVLQARNVWARPQVVTIAFVPAGSPPGTAADLLPEAGAVYLQQFEAYARARMYVSGEHKVLGDSLDGRAGFSMRIPRVYRVSEPDPGLFVFRNDQPDPSRLIRQVAVARRPLEEVEMSAESARAWRADVAALTTMPPQLTDSAPGIRTDLRLDGHPAIEIPGTWLNPSGNWPAGGPVITRLVQCPPYIYLVDAWLYAPGRAKYEYMIQLRTLLDSFRCAG